MIVRVRKGPLEWFRRKARATDKEIMAVLVGKHFSKAVLEIHHFRYPDCRTTPSSVPETDVSDIATEAKQLGFYMVGTIHSHPNAPPVMSPTDYYGHIEDGDKVSGIVEVTDGRTRVAFWKHDSALRCTLEYF